MKPSRWWIAFILCVVVTGCGGGDDRSSTPTHQTSLSTPSVATPTPGQPGYVSSPQPEPGRPAPDVASGVLTFNRIRVYASTSSGNYVVRANVVNTGTQFLNGAAIDWRILDDSGQTLDEGDTIVATLAPGETTTVELEGDTAHDDGWSSVAFEFTGASQ